MFSVISTENAIVANAIEAVRSERRNASNTRKTMTADTNVRARKLFESFEFEVLDENHGSYDGGQRAIRMRHKLPRTDKVKW